MKDKTEIGHIIDINLMMNKFLFLVLVVTVVVAVPATTAIHANAQTTTPPPLESNKPLLPTATADENDKEPAAIPSLGKITIQISQTEQIVLDLPLKSDNKYQVVPIK